MHLSEYQIGQWKEQLGSRPVEEVLRDITAAAGGLAASLRDTLINLQGQAVELRHQEINNVIDPGEATLRWNDLRRDLLQLLDAIGEELAAQGRKALTITLAEDEAGFRRLFQKRLLSEPERYELRECLSNGDYANVYLALEHPGAPFQRAVAIKVFKTLSLIDRENQEELNTNLARASLLGDDDGVISIRKARMDVLPRYYVMPFIPGMPLSTRLKQGWPFSRQNAYDILREVAQALRAGHARGLVHSNLRPSNIFLSREGRAMIIPFQVVRFTLTYRDMARVAELATYASPEQINARDAGPASDEYSLALVAVELFTGKPLFHGETILDILHARMLLEQHPGRLADALAGTECPSHFIPVLERMLLPDPGQRFGDLEEVLWAIDDLRPTGQHTRETGRRELQRSFDFCRRQESFYRSFYERFLRSRPEAAALFQEAFATRQQSNDIGEETLWRFQHDMLDLAVERLLAYAHAPERLRQPLEALISRHRQLGVATADFPVFLQCLRETLMEYDADRWAQHRAALDMAWEEVTRPLVLST